MRTNPEYQALIADTLAQGIVNTNCSNTLQNHQIVLEFSISICVNVS